MVGASETDIPRPARCQGIGNGTTARRGKSPHHVQNRIAATGPEIGCQQAVIGQQVIQGGEMTLDEIHDVDVVANAGAVGRRIIAAENVQALASAVGDLRHIRQEIIRHAIRRLADQSAFMGANRVEITQARDSPVRIGMRQISQHVFDHQFAGAVGIGRRTREIFFDRHRGRVAINRCRRTEHKGFNVAFRHLAE